MDYSKTYTIGFATAVCLGCAVIVAGSAVGLRERQEQNKVLDRQKKVLLVAGLMEEGEQIDRAEVEQRFSNAIKPLVIDLKTGAPVTDADAATFDQAAAMKDPATSTKAPKNDAKVRRLPNQALVYQVVKGGALQMVVLPVQGKGLWSTLYGFLAMAADGDTILGLTFYEHGETPGLGGEVDNPRWKALWRGRKAYDRDSGQPIIRVIKGQAPPAKEAPYRVDGLSGATLTSKGVTHLVQFWLGDSGFKPFLDTVKAAGGVL